MSHTGIDEKAGSRHIVLVTGGLQAGGAERVLSQMADYWVSEGCRVTLATWSHSNEEDFYSLDSRVERVWLVQETVGGSKWRQLIYMLVRIRRLRTLIKQSQPDCVLSFITTSNILTLLATRGLGVRVVISERVAPKADVTVSRLWRWLRKLTYASADKIVVQSRVSVPWVQKVIGRTPVVIANPMRTMPAVDRQRDKVIVATGRLAHQKGFDLLIRAFKLVSEACHDWRVEIVGAGAELENLTQLRDELGLQQQIEFVGQVRNVEDWMAKAGIVVQPSRFEGFPNVLLESMGMGAAVISSDCPSGPADMIQNGVNGRLVPVGDIEALASAMKELIDSPGMRTEMGAEARKISSEYQQATIMEQWNDVVFNDTNALRT